MKTLNETLTDLQRSGMSERSGYPVDEVTVRGIIRPAGGFVVITYDDGTYLISQKFGGR